MIQKNLKKEEKPHTSFKEKIKELFKTPKDVISFLLPIVIALILIIPVPYTVTVGGGAINIDEKIVIENEHIGNGSFNSAYVKELKGRIITYLLAKIVPSYELTPLEVVTLENESSKDYDYREKSYFSSSLDNATIVAYKAANKEIKIIDEDVFVMYILDEAETNLEVQDQILEIDGNKIEGQAMMSSLINNYEVGDKVGLKVLRNNKEEDCYFVVKELEQAKKIGIYLSTKYVYETDPDIEFDFTSRESGPSGGLMIALTIYNKLVEEDITKGKVIVGTGTIDVDGNVGEIGGVKEKLAGAVRFGADTFIVPNENYDEAIDIVAKEDYEIEIISVATFEEALQKLKEN